MSTYFWWVIFVAKIKIYVVGSTIASFKSPFFIRIIRNTSSSPNYTKMLRIGAFLPGKNKMISKDFTFCLCLIYKKKCRLYNIFRYEDLHSLLNSSIWTLRHLKTKAKLYTSIIYRYMYTAIHQVIHTKLDKYIFTYNHIKVLRNAVCILTTCTCFHLHTIMNNSSRNIQHNLFHKF